MTPIEQQKMEIIGRVIERGMRQRDERIQALEEAAAVTRGHMEMLLQTVQMLSNQIVRDLAKRATAKASERAAARAERLPALVPARLPTTRQDAMQLDAELQHWS